MKRKIRRKNLSFQQTRRFECASAPFKCRATLWRWELPSAAHTLKYNRQISSQSAATRALSVIYITKMEDAQFRALHKSDTRKYTTGNLTAYL